jgi:steroid delta-isomerase-like uncharacterized protein
MTTENAEIVRSYLQKVWNGRNVDRIDELLADGFVAHGLPAHLPSGRQGVRAYVENTVGTFSDFKVVVDDVVAEGDKVAVRLTFSGTQKGAFHGVPATGKSFSISAMAFARLADGKIAEWWENADVLGLMQQIGAMPS